MMPELPTSDIIIIDSLKTKGYFQTLINGIEYTYTLASTLEWYLSKDYNFMGQSSCGWAVGGSTHHSAHMIFTTYTLQKTKKE